MKVYILPEVYAEIMHYVHKSDVEISGVGRVKRDAQGNLVVCKVYLPKQENAATSTDIDQDDMGRILYESRNDEGDLNFWWHSHVNMGAFWSGTDMATIKQFGGNGYLVSTVFNKKYEYRTAIYRAGDGFFPEMFMDNIETRFEYVPTDAQRADWDANMAKFCSTKKWVPATTYYKGITSQNWSGGDDDIMSRPSTFDDPFFWQQDLPIDYADKPKGKKKGKRTKLIENTVTYTAAELVSVLNLRLPIDKLTPEQAARVEYAINKTYGAMDRYLMEQVYSEVIQSPSATAELVEWIQEEQYV